jgi:hypothetical protein
LWQSPRNLYTSGCLEPNKKLLVMGPHRPCGSIAKGSSIMSCLRRSPMTSSPVIVVVASLGFCLVLCLYFLHSNFWICLSALAVMEEIAISEKLSESGVVLYVMVMSAPMVEYGQGVCGELCVVRSGLKEMSKGRAEISLVLICGVSTSRCVVFPMYPAVARAS